MTRECSGCTLCCRLLPVKEIHKPASTRCEHQRTGVGCKIYNRLPFSCQVWTCRWLVNDDTAELPRPDRSHYVIDILPDFITIEPHDGTAPTNVEVVQVWVDPKHRDAWRAPELLAYLERRGQDGIAAIIRYGAREGFTLFPPTMSSDREWHEIHSHELRREHSFEERALAIAGAARKIMVEP